MAMKVMYLRIFENYYIHSVTFIHLAQKLDEENANRHTQI